MKMKLLDCALVTLLAGMAPAPVPAQEAATDTAPGTAGPADAPVECSGGECRQGDEIVMRVRTRGEREPATPPGTAGTADALQPDRRVTVETGSPGRAVVVGKWSVQLPGGG